MADIPAIKVDIDDSSLDAFLAKFERAKELAGEGVHAHWNTAASAGVGSTAGGASGGGGAAQAQAQAFQNANRAAQTLSNTLNKGTFKGNNSFIEVFARRSKEIDKSWININKTFANVGRGFNDTFRALVGGPAALLRLMGAAGLAVGAAVGGATAISSDFAAQNRQNRSLGLKPGELQAFTNDYEKYGLGEGDVANINAARNDIRQRWIFQNAGINDNDIDTLPATELLARMDKYAGEKQRQAKATGTDLHSTMQAYGLDQLFSVQQVMSAGSYSDEQHDKSLVDYRSDVPKMAANQSNLDRATQQWNDIKNAWDKAKNQIENALSPITPAVVEGIKNFSDAVVEFAQSEGLKDSVDETVTAFNHLKDVVTWIVDHSKPGESNEAQLGNAAIDLWHDAKAGNWKQFWTDLNRPVTDDAPPSAPASTPGYPPAPKPAKIPSAPTKQDFSTLEKQYSLPAGLLANIEQQESSGGKNPDLGSNQDFGPAGPFQLAKATGNRYGVTDRMNEQQSATGAAKYFNDLLKKYHGDLAEAVAAYDGDTSLDSDIKKYGEDWIKHAPTETQKYLADMQGRGADFGDSVRKQLAGIVDKNRIPDESIQTSAGSASNRKATPVMLTTNVNVTAPPGFDVSVATAQQNYGY